MSQQGVDPVGDRLDYMAEVILAFRPGGRRRLTVDWNVARELAEELDDALDEYDGEAEPS